MTHDVSIDLIEDWLPTFGYDRMDYDRRISYDLMLLSMSSNVIMVTTSAELLGLTGLFAQEALLPKNSCTVDAHTRIVSVVS